MAFLSAYWSGSELAGGKQAGATLLESTTGESKIMMAISLAYSKAGGSELNIKKELRSD
jgi:hypothetical protein